MERKEKNCCENNSGFGNVEALVSIDERGQMVLPKEIRDKADIHPGDKLALVSGYKDDKICCLFLIKTGELAGMVKTMLGPVAKEIIK